MAASSARLARETYPTHFDGPKAEVDPNAVLKAIIRAIAALRPAARRVDAINLSVMSPAWVAMDRKGKPLTNIITHQDRRSVVVARDLESRVGISRFLKITGNRPFPGSSSITPLAWYLKHAPTVIRRADLIGHLNTFLHRQLTDSRVIDPSNASFTGLYETLKLGSWSEELCDAAGVPISKLPQIYDADQIAGSITPRRSQIRPHPRHPRDGRHGRHQRRPDALRSSRRPTAQRQRLNRCPLPPAPITRARTTISSLPRPGRRKTSWLSVSTLAAAGSAIAWVHNQFFRDFPEKRFYALIAKLARRCPETKVMFDPYLAGDRTDIEQKTAAFTNLTLATTRDDHAYGAMIDALAKASGARLQLLKSRGTKILATVYISGGSARVLHQRPLPRLARPLEFQIRKRSLVCVASRSSRPRKR